MTEFQNALNDSSLELAHGPEGRSGYSIAKWLAEYVIDNCETNGGDVMSLDEALDVYPVVFEDEDLDEVEVTLTTDDLGDDGVEHYEALLNEFSENLELEDE